MLRLKVEHKNEGEFLIAQASTTTSSVNFSMSRVFNSIEEAIKSVITNPLTNDE